MSIAGALSALSYVALAGAVIWLIGLFRKIGRLERENADLRENNRIKDEQLKAASNAPRNRDELVDRVRERGL